MDFVPFLVALGLSIGTLLLGAVFGRIIEARHFRSLARRESEYTDMLVTDTRTLPPGGSGGVLVAGEAVVACDRWKQILGSIRDLIGGEVRSFETIMTRARREAFLRLLADARRVGADAVVNVRFETVEVGGLAADVLCYGTAVTRPAR